MALPTVSQLEALNPLQKLHLSWPFQETPDTDDIPLWDSGNAALLAQYIRITGSCPLSCEYYSSAQLSAIEAMSPEPSLCLTTSPYQTMATNHDPAAYVATDMLTDLAALDTHLNGLSAVASLIKYVVIDIEIWNYAPIGTDDPNYMIEKYNLVSQLISHYLPSAVQIFYSRGAITPNEADPSGWRAVAWYPAGSPGAVNSCSLYLAEWAANQEVYTKTVANSGGLPVVPFLALGGAQPRTGGSWGAFAAGGYTYPAAAQIGAEINLAYFAASPLKYPVSTAPYVFFWPAAFDPNYPDWGNEFIAYCEGAGNQTLTV